MYLFNLFALKKTHYFKIYLKQSVLVCNLKASLNVGRYLLFVRFFFFTFKLFFNYLFVKIFPLTKLRLKSINIRQENEMKVWYYTNNKFDPILVYVGYRLLIFKVT